MKKHTLEKIFEQHRPLISKAVHAQQTQILGITVDDIEQEVCIRLIKVLQSDREITHLASYIYKMTSNVIIDLARKQQKFQLETGMPEEASEDQRPEWANELAEPSEYTEDGELMRIVQDAIESLPKARRMAAKMRLQGFSIKEMCELTGWSFYKAENLSKRSMLALREKLQKAGVSYEVD